MFAIAALMVVLPFAYGREERGVDASVVVAALVVTGFGVFMTFAFVAMARTRITLDAATLDATVVDGHSRLLVPHFRSVRLPFHDIRAVERRIEIVRMLGLTTQRDALSVVAAGGARIGLFSNTLGSADTLPLDDVANAIAAAAGVAVTDDGSVRSRGWGLYGMASSSWTEPPLDPVSASRAERAVRLTALICTGLLLLTFALRAFL
jgi:hypothetical protein